MPALPARACCHPCMWILAGPQRFAHMFITIRSSFLRRLVCRHLDCFLCLCSTAGESKNSLVMHPTSNTVVCTLWGTYHTCALLGSWTHPGALMQASNLLLEQRTEAAAKGMRTPALDQCCLQHTCKRCEQKQGLHRSWPVKASVQISGTRPRFLWLDKGQG